MGFGIQMKQGILPDILNFMRLAGEQLTEMQKCVVLQYDEMKLKSVLEFDNAEDEIVGPYNYMQVIMVRGLFSKWKQPIFIDFDTKITKIYLLMEVINKLYDISYTVAACVSD
ncbi:hypothetical protein JTB14_001988 [Gonioctena quinquepunctata]|nr:hypothetical protein JTB14_001988 [Gonioctena quinquepunctata]